MGLRHLIGGGWALGALLWVARRPALSAPASSVPSREAAGARASARACFWL